MALYGTPFYQGSPCWACSVNWAPGASPDRWPAVIKGQGSLFHQKVGVSKNFPTQFVWRKEPDHDPFSIFRSTPECKPLLHRHQGAGLMEPKQAFLTVGVLALQGARLLEGVNTQSTYQHVPSFCFSHSLVPQALFKLAPEAPPFIHLPPPFLPCHSRLKC